ncbi:sensor histidine kinase [Granulosicoccus antarcticus]|uniref:histidine kinase n=1 Tax=Granulosicoccus antarcticus IMCC3135 TaxID=1192854 RepID=A0A2Z2NYJ0_9GAMM|nr:ATP-binding protein [Granulosicoccus antarcticus]ASJ73920.1 Phytochrome-like protein cph1 [Granulosicoccus antarcticus IMCC3135]
MKMDRRWWLLSLTVMALLVVIQFWSTKDVDRRTAELHSLLSETQTSAMQLMQRVGYGGLIFHFKNLVLRPHETDNHASAVADAKQVTLLIAELETNAASMGVEFKLSSTRAMVNAYLPRLDEVQRLYQQGYSSIDIDRAVRFNDVFAIREIDLLIDELSAVVRSQVRQIKHEGKLLNWISMGGTIALSSLVLALLFNQNNRRNYVDAIQQMNAELETSNTGLTSVNKSLKQFAGIVSHDLRTPLRHIGHFSDRIIEDCNDPAEVTQHATIIIDAVARMDRIIASLLEFTRSGFKRPELSPIDVQELVTSVVQELDTTIKSAGATINLHLDGYVQADAELLRRVLHNLLGNSLKYTHPERSPRIDLEAVPVGESIQFSISDNGIGIAPEFAERIFEPCQRLHDSQNQYEGSGIGLTLVKAIIEAHGGSIKLDTAYTAGTRIVFSLNAADSPPLMNAA